MAIGTNQRSFLLSLIKDKLPGLYGKYHLGYGDDRLWNATNKICSIQYRRLLAKTYQGLEDEVEAELLPRIKT